MYLVTYIEMVANPFRSAAPPLSMRLSLTITTVWFGNQWSMNYPKDLIYGLEHVRIRSQLSKYRLKSSILKFPGTWTGIEHNAFTFEIGIFSWDVFYD